MLPVETLLNNDLENTCRPSVKVIINKYLTNFQWKYQLYGKVLEPNSFEMSDIEEKEALSQPVPAPTKRPSTASSQSKKQKKSLGPPIAWDSTKTNFPNLV